VRLELIRLHSLTDLLPSLFFFSTIFHALTPCTCCRFALFYGLFMEDMSCLPSLRTATGDIEEDSRLEAVFSSTSRWSRRSHSSTGDHPSGCSRLPSGVTHIRHDNHGFRMLLFASYSAIFNEDDLDRESLRGTGPINATSRDENMSGSVESTSAHELELLPPLVHPIGRDGANQVR